MGRELSAPVPQGLDTRISGAACSLHYRLA